MYNLLINKYKAKIFYNISLIIIAIKFLINKYKAKYLYFFIFILKIN